MITWSFFVSPHTLHTLHTSVVGSFFSASVFSFFVAFNDRDARRTGTMEFKTLPRCKRRKISSDGVYPGQKVLSTERKPKKRNVRDGQPDLLPSSCISLPLPLLLRPADRRESSLSSPLQKNVSFTFFVNKKRGLQMYFENRGMS